MSLCQKNRFALDQSQNRYLKNICSRNVIQQKHIKDEHIPSPICINETDINDNVISDNNEGFPSPKGTIYGIKYSRVDQVKFAEDSL